MNDTVAKLMGMVQAYASDYAHALMVTGVGSDPRDSHQALEDELTRLFTPLTDEQIGAIERGLPIDDYAHDLTRRVERLHGITGESK